LRNLIFSLIILAAYLPGCRHAPAAHPPPAPLKRPVHFVNFETGANVKSLAFEGKYLWLGLSNGIIRYDVSTSDQYKIFTTRSTSGLLSNGIYKVAVDAKGTKWLGTYGGGLSRFDGQKWISYTPYGGGETDYGKGWTVYPAGSGLGDLWVYDILFEEGGVAWIATWKGVSRFDGQNFKTYREEDGLLDQWVYAIAKDQKGLLWFGTEGGVNSFDGTSWQSYTHQDGLGAAIGLASGSPSQSEGGDYGGRGHHGGSRKGNQQANPNFVLDIAVDRENVKWIGTWGAGLSRFDGTRWTSYTAGTGTIGGNFVHALELDESGVLWIATDGGVTRFDGETWITYTTADGLLDNNVFSIAFDTSGNKWFGTWSGLSKMLD